MLSLAGTLLVIITLGFAINRRIVRITSSDIEAEGGDTDDIDPDPVSASTHARVSRVIEEY